MLIKIWNNTYDSMEELVSSMSARARSWSVDNPGQWAPADHYRDYPGSKENGHLVLEAAVLMLKRATHPGEFLTAMHLGEGHMEYYEALLDRLEGQGGPIPKEITKELAFFTLNGSLRETLMNSLLCEAVHSNPKLRARANDLIEKLK
ncbi:hypothetical protein IPG41_06445 [Candidatus Peregrinibacteria bacterium]|nr:MAG: hypothetical protein IPG41_06445 [Candidatus Peregrinibacteria bacterium]